MELDVFHLFLWDPIWFEGTPFEINRVVLLMYVAAIFCIGFFFFGTRKMGLVPRRWMQNVVETGYLFVKDRIAIDVIGPEGVKYATYLAILFFFIFFSNVLEIIPGINFPVTSRMAIPALLSGLTWIIFNFVGFAKHGFGYLKDILFPPGVPKAIYIILTPIEFFSVFFIRPLTLAIRLFANMMAGHVLLTVFFLFTEELLLGKLIGVPLGLITFAVACGLILFELMIMSIQAYIFTVLSAFYIAEALHGHGDEPAHETHGPETEETRTPDYETELQPA